jgi:hypothetical protein
MLIFQLRIYCIIHNLVISYHISDSNSQFELNSYITLIFLLLNIIIIVVEIMKMKIENVKNNKFIFIFIFFHN